MLKKMKVYNYKEDKKYKKFTLRQEMKKIAISFYVLFILGFLLIVLPSLIIEPIATINAGGTVYGDYSQESLKLINNLFYTGLFILVGSFILNVLLFNKFSIVLTRIKNSINGKKVISKGGLISYFNNNEISITFEK